MRIQMLVVGIALLAAPAAAEEITLDPGEHRGRSVDHRELLPGDVIVTTGVSWLSKAIAELTGAAVSHGLLYLGGPGCTEAEEPSGCLAVHAAEVPGELAARVQVRPVRDILWDPTHSYALAVAYRVPGLTDEQRDAIGDFAKAQEGKSFDLVGMVSNAGYAIPKALCDLIGLEGDTKAACLEGTLVGKLPERFAQTNVKEGFYCTELIFEAYREAAGLDLVEGGTPEVSAPGDVPLLERKGEMEYVGHLIH